MRAVIELFAWMGTVVARIFRDARDGAARLLRGGVTYSVNWLCDSPKGLYGLSVARFGMGITAFLMLAANFHTRYYTYGGGVVWSGERIAPVSDFPKIWLLSSFYSVSLNDGAFTALYIVLMVLSLVFAIGYRTRLTMILFGILWLSFIKVTDFIGDQSDNIFRMSLIYMLFMDISARWSVDAIRRRRSRNRVNPSVFSRVMSGAPVVEPWLRNALHNLALIVLAAQISFIYVSGALYKAGGQPWQDGTAIYAPIHVERFGTWPVLSDITTAWTPGVGFLTWGALLTQLAFPFLLIHPWTRKVGIIAITGTHLGIGLLMGLPFFSLTMIALDMIFVSTKTWQWAGRWSRRTFAIPAEWRRSRTSAREPRSALPT
ncbi:HTTM domain-containing protein [Microbacterium enclense]|uniref:Vitamin K-dependent gamma-carboxylase n=2 Tax=Microbacterium enclense TaxID=993073 RepID=A0A1G6JIY0_9MICO|nr:HTTM domain-containing protein [Microbacterium enclense]KSU54853.1 hypothetical protein AS029_07865 [Microbacterium enclense]MCM3613818.1 HTTM domain-containing protein [Microbacterium enclense]SDC18405.1 Vitamin K-dependent gamma-carboxylase [Microbacterium enclense]